MPLMNVLQSIRDLSEGLLRSKARDGHSSAAGVGGLGGWLSVFTESANSQVSLVSNPCEYGGNTVFAGVR